MLFFRRQLHALLWVALLAIAGLALAPTVSRLLASVQSQGWLLEICGPGGSRGLALSELSQAGEAGGGSREALAVNLLEHCQLCGLAAAATLPPGEAATWLPLPQDRLDPDVRALREPRLLLVWSSAQPRAPPAGA